MDKADLIEWIGAFPDGTRFQGNEDGDIVALVGDWPQAYFVAPDLPPAIE